MFFEKLQRILKRSSLLRNAGVYSLSNILNGSLVFLLLPLFTRHLNTEEYGILSLFRVIASFVYPLVAFFPSMGRQYFEREHIDFDRYVGNTLMVIAANTVWIIILAYSFSDLLESATGFPAAWVWAVVLFAVCQSIVRAQLLLFQVKVKPHLYGMLQNSLTSLNLILAIFFVTVWELNWHGGILADVCSYAVFAIIAFYLLLKTGVEFKLDRSYITDNIKFNGPIAIHLVGRSILTMSDKIIIVSMTGVSEMGRYAAGYQIALVIFVLSQSFQSAWMPVVYENLKKGEREGLVYIFKTIYLFSAVILVMSILLGLLAPYIVSVLLGDKFHSAYVYVPWVATGFALNGIYMVLANIISYKKKTHVLAAITLFAAVLNIVLNLVFVEINGALGAAQATFVTFAVVLLLTVYSVGKMVRIPWFLK